MRSIWASARNTSKLLCVSLVALSYCAVSAQSNDPLVTFQQYTKGQSDRAYADVERGLGTIPKDIRDALVESGYSVVITPTMLTAMPGWDGAQPRGWREDANYDNVGGMFQPRTLRVIVCETTQDMRQPAKYNWNGHIDTTARHEIGHAWDFYQGRASLNDDFSDAYSKDSEHFNNEQQREFAYFLQPNGAGNSELFAELFAATYTPDADSSPRFARLLAAFPRTTAYILKLNPKRAKWEKKPEGPVSAPVEGESSKATDSKSSSIQPWNGTYHLEDPNAEMMAKYREISALWAQGHLAEAEPLMAVYIKLMEHNHVAPARLKQTYESYAGLLRKLHRDAEAARVDEKARTLP